MAWEKRAHSSSLYYYHSRREDGRVVKDYISRQHAETYEFCADCTRADSLERHEERTAREAEARAIDAPLEALYITVDEVVRVHLLAAGYHQHHRGGWRKRRG